jgi:hypothetical protein
MRLVFFSALLVPLVSCATLHVSHEWSEPDTRALWEILKLSERNAAYFTTHQALFQGTLENYRDRFAPGLDLATPHSRVVCGSVAGSPTVLPVSSEAVVSALVQLSPALARCLDKERLNTFGNFHEAVADSALVALDRYSRLVVPGSPPPTDLESLSLPWEPILLDTIAYLPVPNFNMGASEYIKTALRSFQEQDIDGLVVDLRGNMGGLVTEISDSLGHFAPPGTYLFAVVGRSPRNSAQHNSRGADLLPGTSIVVLVDRSTASGGELVALSLRELRSALVVGEPTAGYSSIQTVYPLSNGWGAAITTSVWVAPRSIRIPKTGVLPNVIVREDPQSETDEALVRAFEILSE